MNVIVAGLAKTGTTGLYTTVKRSLCESVGDPVCLFEPKNIKPIEHYFKEIRKKSVDSFSERPLLCKVMLKKEFFEKPHILDKFDKKIMIVRDPRDRLLSMLLFKALSRPKSVEKSIPEFINLLEEKENNPSSMSFVELCEKVKQLGMGEINIKKSIELLEFQNEMICKHGFHKVFYEEFVDGNTQGLQDYLGLGKINNESQSKWLQHIERSKGHGEWRNWFTHKDIIQLAPLLDEAISHTGYSNNWDIFKDQEINPESSSKYIKKKFPKRLYQVTKLNNDFDQESFNILQLRADDGKISDIYELAHLYENGSAFLDQDMDMALYYYNLGAIFGHAGCVKKIDLYENK